MLFSKCEGYRVFEPGAFLAPQFPVVEPFCQRLCDVLAPQLAEAGEPRGSLIICLEVDRACCSADAVLNFVIFGRPRDDAHHMCDIVRHPSGTGQDAAEHECSVVAHPLSGVVLFEHAGDRELGYREF